MKDKREEIEKNEKREKISEALDNISSRHIEEAADFVPTKMPLSRKKIILRCIAVAACVALMLCTVIIPLMFRKDEPEAPMGAEESDKENDFIVDYKPITLDATLSPEKLSGSNSAFVVGNASSGQAMGEPPFFEFGVGGFVVKAKVVENYPDTYSKLYDYYLNEYLTHRLVKLEVLEVINGEDMPREFLYLIPEPLFVDMSEYDYLLISMMQVGTEGYTIKNCTKNQIEVLDLPLFLDGRYGRPDLGSVIAFTDDMFDESLWQNPKWGYGYQCVVRRLEDPDEKYLVVRRGDSIDDVISVIRAQHEYHYSDNYTPPKLVTLNFNSQNAKSVIEYVKPFENGVFAQDLQYSQIRFIRFINGCQTDEMLKIDLNTEEVSCWGGIRYTEEEMKSIENMAMQLEAKAAEYKKQPPTPSNTFPDVIKFIRLSLQAFYMKIDGNIYGVLNISYIYRDIEADFSNLEEEIYILYDMQNSETQSFSYKEYREKFDFLHAYIEWTPH
jgi:hypothetical protein